MPGAAENMTLAADTDPSPTLEDKITMLEDLFPDTPPEHDAVNMYKTNNGSKKILFCGGDFVREVGRTISKMSTDNKGRLMKIPWMKCELKLMESSESGYPSTPYYDEMLTMITECCKENYPEVRDQYVMTRENGQRMMFNPFKAIDVVAKHWRKPHGPSKKAVQAFRDLPWANATVSKWDRQIDSTRKSRSVSRMAKIRFLCIFYPKEQPGWLDEIPIFLHTNEVWIFKPVQWLDDIVNVWLGGKSPVALTMEEKETLEKLPWVLPWVERVRQKRLKKRKHNESVAADTPCSNAPSKGGSEYHSLPDTDEYDEYDTEVDHKINGWCEAGSSQDTAIPDALAQSDDEQD
jgi:hypothetical protein|tara:strand:+ start:3237 stop:4283 length:1047 start_codon:yes stop_codon:yes gene_type:complete